MYCVAGRNRLTTYQLSLKTKLCRPKHRNRQLACTEGHGPGFNVPASYSESLHFKFQLALWWNRAIAQAVSGGLPTEAVQVRTQIRACGICSR
jgi:hypothetical protein